MTAEPRHSRGREEASTRELLAAMSFGDPGDQLRLRDLLTGAETRLQNGVLASSMPPHSAAVWLALNT